MVCQICRTDLSFLVFRRFDGYAAYPHRRVVRGGDSKRGRRCYRREPPSPGLKTSKISLKDISKCYYLYSDISRIKGFWFANSRHSPEENRKEGRERDDNIYPHCERMVFFDYE